MAKKKNDNPEELQYYRLDRIKKENAQYNIIYGERSNGKSFAVEEEILLNYIKTGEQGAIIRRYDTDLQGKLGQAVFEHFVSNPKRGNIIEQITNGKWNSIYYYSQRWYLSYIDENNNRTKDIDPFCYGFTLAGQEHVKSTSYPRVTTILFDEFMTRIYYLPDEFVTFVNVLSTIIRDRDNVKIYMCGNTVNKFNPYFKEMGLDNVLKMKQGDIQIYKFAAMKDKVLTIAVEYSDGIAKNGKPSDVYFAFNNPKLKMITNGMWEVALYPHLPYKYKQKDIQFTFFIIWERNILQCELIQVYDEDKKITVTFIYIHMKTTELQNDCEDLIYSTDYDSRLNWRRKITKPIDDIDRKLMWFFKSEKVFYQDNEVGELVRNYMVWCATDKGFV